MKKEMKAFKTLEEIMEFTQKNNYRIENSKEEIVAFMKNNKEKYIYLFGADLSEADLSNVDLTRNMLHCANFKGAKYNKNTIFPQGFDVVKKKQMILVD